MIVIADPNADFRSRVADAVDREDGLGFVESRDELVSLLSVRDDDIDAIVLGPGLEFSIALSIATQLRAEAAPTSVVVCVEDLRPELLRDAMKAGVHDVLPAHFDGGELAESLREARRHASTVRAREPAVPTDASARDGTVVTVFSSKGGCGKSVVACNLAILLSRVSGEQVALVDLDLESGDLAIMLQVIPALSLFDAAEKADRLDTEAIAGYLTAHESGIDLLAAPPEPSLAGAISGDAVRAILELLRSTYRYVVIDGPSSFTDQLLAGLDGSDELVLVTTLDVPSVKNLKLAMQTLEQLGWHRDGLRLVLNRADSEVGLRVRDVERTLGTTIDVNVPSSRDVPLSVNEGEPVAQRRARSPVVDALETLAVDMHGVESPVVRHGDGHVNGNDTGLLGRLFGKAHA